MKTRKEEWPVGWLWLGLALVGVWVGLAWIIARRKDPMIGFRVSIWKELRQNMWVPVDQIEVGEECLLKVVAVKKSGVIVDLSPADYSASDGVYAEVVGDLVRGREEGVAIITATLLANPTITGVALLAVADPIVSLELQLGRNMEGPDDVPG